MGQPFRGVECFAPLAAYQLLPFRFMRWEDGSVLLVSDVGEHHFLEADEFRRLTCYELDHRTATYLDLKAKHFLWDPDSLTPLDLVATKYRTKKDFLRGFTGLHIFVVTLRCDHSCTYCQVSRVTEDRTTFDMSDETARRAIDLLFRSPSPTLKVEFQGGEPLLTMERITDIVEAIEERNVTEQRRIEFVIATNLSTLDDGILAFCKAHDVHLSTSLDGPAWLHDQNRPTRARNSHTRTIEQIERARAALGHDRVSALMTTTARSLAHPREIVREYLRHGFTEIFLRSVSPYGFAVKTGQAALYEAHQFVQFYREALDEIISANREGRAVVEVYAQLLLRKILTPFPTHYVDLQSPAGTGIGAVVYNYDGDVYASDEARMLAAMGDKSFRLGDLHTDTYEELFGSDVLQALIQGSVLETMPGCSECAFLPYCGADPIYHHATQGDIIGHRPTSAFCAKHMGILRHLFTLLRAGDQFVTDLFTSWAWQQPTRV
jgi:His-Xaa-Ser system radical SAM maturase HxsB